jgi:hypothetical protein
MNIPPDDQNPGLGFDPNPIADYSLSKKGGSKVPLILVGVAVIGAIGYFVWSGKKQHEERKLNAQFMERFQGFEHDDLMKFWGCVLGPNTDGSTAQSPEQIMTKIDVMFAADFKAYPGRIQEDCAKAAKDAQNQVTGLGAPAAYVASIDAYGKTIVAMSDALNEWAKVAPDQVQAKMIGKNVEEYGGAYHAYAGGAPAAEVIAYDQFLHCADPQVDTRKDNLTLAQALFESCKDAKYRDKLQNECGKLVIDKPAAPTKNWKTALQKIGSESRDVDAFGDCLKKARKGKLKDNLSPVGKNWVAYRQAREAVLKIGQEALKE